DHSGANERVIYPFGLYLAFASPLNDLSPQDAASLRRRLPWDDELDSPDENFLVALNAIWKGGDAFEIGYPEKLTNIRKDWAARVTWRAGRLALPSSPLSDNDLMERAQEVRGGSGVYLYRVTSPRFAEEWALA